MHIQIIFLEDFFDKKAEEKQAMKGREWDVQQNGHFQESNQRPLHRPRTWVCTETARPAKPHPLQINPYGHMHLYYVL